MKTKNLTLSKPKKLPSGFTIDPTLKGKYDSEPFFKDKLHKVNDLIEKVGLPKT